jgi:hypothetical protein
MYIWGIFALVKLPGREADHSAATKIEVNKTSIYTPTRPYIFIASFWLELIQVHYYCDHSLGYCTSPGRYMVMIVEQLVE